MKFPTDRPVGHYHCISRIVDRRFIFDEAEKEQFTRLMREYEVFCHVRVLTFCVMSNHYHILLEVPKRPDVLPTAEELLEMLKGLEFKDDYARTKAQLEVFRGARDGDGEKALLERFFRRMWDVSWFNRLLKQRFSAWYNHRTGRKGTLWEERFKSVLGGWMWGSLADHSRLYRFEPGTRGIDPGPERVSLLRLRRSGGWHSDRQGGIQVFNERAGRS